MTFLNRVTSQPPQEGQKIVIAGVEGTGKTTLAADAPRALFIPMEFNYKTVKAARSPDILSYNDLFLLLDEIRDSCQKGQFKYKTLVFDSATAFERLIHNKIILEDDKVKKGLDKHPTMESVHGGYGKGYQLANELFQRFTNYCDQFTRLAGLNIVVTCHTFPSLVRDAAYGEYYSWDLLLHSPKNDKNYGKRELITQWANLIGFLHDPMFVSKQEGQNMTRAVSAGQGRMLAVERSPGWVAKNQYGIVGPASLIPIPAPKPIGPGGGWNALAHRIYNCSGIDVYNKD